jgi:polysaccharide pyruvyl transferase CsaB
MTTGPARAVAIGYVGFGNAGDEAILSGVEQLLASTPVTIESIVAGDRAPITAFPGARRLVARRLLPNRARLDALRVTDVVVFTGGGLLHDHWPLVVPQYLAWSLLARAHRSRIIWLSLGIGPLSHWWSRLLARITLRLANLVVVRDRHSAELARALGHAAVAVATDAAFYMDRPIRSSTAARGLGLVVRAPVHEDEELGRRLANCLADYAIQESSVPPVIVTLAGDRDRQFADRVASLLAARGRAASIEELPSNPSVALGRLAAFEAVVTVRLHGMILASLAGTPWVAIGYDDKVLTVARELGASDQVVGLRTLDPGSLAAAMLRASDPKQLDHVEHAVERLRETRAEVARLVSQVVAQ